MEESILDLSYGRKDQIIIEAFTDLGSIPWKKGSWIYPLEERILDLSYGRKDQIFEFLYKSKGIEPQIIFL